MGQISFQAALFAQIGLEYLAAIDKLDALFPTEIRDKIWAALDGLAPHDCAAVLALFDTLNCVGGI